MTEPPLSDVLLDELEGVASEVATAAAQILQDYSEAPLEDVTHEVVPH